MGLRWLRGYGNSDAPTADAGLLETLTPARAPDVKADFVTPALQSLFSGGIGGLAGALIAWRAEQDVLLWAAIGFVGVLAAAWAFSLGLVRDLLWTVERVGRLDLDGDGERGRPGLLVVNAPAAQADVAKTQRAAERQQRLAELIAFVRRCATVGCSESAQGITPARRAVYLDHRDTLLRLGVARWKNAERPRLGWELAVSPAEAIVVIKRHVLTC